MDFVTGLVVGRNEAAAVSREWDEFAQELEQEIADLQTSLRDERISRSKNRSDIAGLQAVLSSLPQDMVLDAMRTHYGPAYLARAAELGLNPVFAQSCMQSAGEATWQKLIAPKPPGR
jgi:hypothetical protein